LPFTPIKGLIVPMLPGLLPVPTAPLPVLVPVEVAPCWYKLIFPLAKPYVPEGTPIKDDLSIVKGDSLAFALSRLITGSVISRLDLGAA
jgi:hypothetical protein